MAPDRHRDEPSPGTDWEARLRRSILVGCLNGLVLVPILFGFVVPRWGQEAVIPFVVGWTASVIADVVAYAVFGKDKWRAG